MLADVICYLKMMSFMALDGVTPFLHLKDLQMRHSQSIGGNSPVQWLKVES